MQDISKWIDGKKGFSFALLRSAAICLTILVLPGCMGTGLDLFGSSGVDRSLSTGTVPVAKTSDGLSDAVAVRNAVTSADISQSGTNAIPWANARSGSAGVISSIQEDRASGMLCRRFTTTRHSYEGIAKFDGSTCQLGNGEWYLTSFGPRG
ncbi:RT0821/Lpp0805 family surface protein [Sinorhizobium numidicum]|uniref:RT0821/Lpp0805 family surface protein n=1 Tax=Sinorhizobium numidicum TaxID=680248 RepID=A0ABY8D1Y8_9HYPH|nr:RT0821/Lpp0805 family surface protein [Sinorhizobium numidicum]WEX78241.1 RT0821/Lpp0805 family surface protein [Sinorhizobium numidicum]WEX84900.1 RT0821/Lpp0805 family surface protein [Sinorhizobium numidicum]